MAGKRKPRLTLNYTDDGLHLGDSILWFDAARQGRLTFLSSASSAVLPDAPQVIATEETVSLVNAMKPKLRLNALVCHYNRPFSIGNMKFELLPSGTMLGAASLFVEIGSKKILYVPKIQTAKMESVRQFQLKRAHSLILGAYSPIPARGFPNRKREWSKAMKSILSQAQKGLQPVVLCDQWGTAQEILSTLRTHNFSIAVQHHIYKISTIYQQRGTELGQFKMVSRRSKEPDIIICDVRKPSRSVNLSGRPVISILPSEQFTTSLQSTETYKISHAADQTELREVVAAVRPKDLYIIGPYATAYAKHLQSTCTNIMPLHENGQPALF